MAKWRGMTAAALAFGAAAAPMAGARAADELPPGDASGAAAKVEGILGVSETGATVDDGSGNASASVVTVGGEPLFDGTSGEQTGEGSQSGALYDTGPTPLGQAQVMPWSASVTDDGTTTEASSEAAVLSLSLLDPAVLEATVLSSSSSASGDSDSSSGSASTDGAVVNALGQLNVTVLHSEVNSENKARSYVLGVNDSVFLSSDQSNGACKIDLDGLISLACLTASGGTVEGVQTATGEVGSVTSPIVPGVNLFTTTGTTAAATAATTTTEPTESPRADEETAVLGTSATRGGSGGLAATGSPVLAQVVAALAMLGLGGCALGAGRRR